MQREGSLTSSPLLPKPSHWYGQLLSEQRAAADFTIEKIKDGGGVALFCQQRSGKTYISCAVIEQLQPKRVLIVAPLTSIDIVWVPRLVTLGRVTREPEEVTEAFQGILVCHWQLFVKTSKRLAKRPWDLVIIDESQGLKARASAQSRAARRFRDAHRRIALSGTPIDECPIDVFGQMRFVDHTVLGEDWTPFAEEYCYKGGFKGRQWKFNATKMPQYLDVLRPHIYRLTVDFLNLKPVKLWPVPVQLLGEQERLYDCMNDHGIIKVNGSTITGSLEITKKVKLQQITGGFVLDGFKAVPVGRAKQRKLAHLLTRITPPLVIFCQFLHEIECIAGILREKFEKVETLHGGIRDKEDDKHRTWLIENFQAGKIDALVCQLRTGGVSIELTKASTLILYSINYSYIDFEQILFRLRGMTQKNELNVFLLYCVKTVDEDKMNVIEKKRSSVWTIVSSFERGR